MATLVTNVRRHPIDRLISVFGNTRFLVTMGLFLAFWYGYNLIAPHPFDPSPFGLLQGIMTGFMSFLDVLILVSARITQKESDKRQKESFNLMENSLTIMSAIRDMNEREIRRDQEMMEVIQELRTLLKKEREQEKQLDRIEENQHG